MELMRNTLEGGITAVRDCGGKDYIEFAMRDAFNAGRFLGPTMRCAGRIEASSISGNFRLLDLRTYHVWAQTSSGNILFTGQFLPNGTYSLKNYSGVIEVRFSPGDSFDLSATSLKGKVNNEAKLTPSAHQHHFMPRWGNALFGTFNEGRAKIEMTSFDGTINILKRD